MNRWKHGLLVVLFSATPLLADMARHPYPAVTYQHIVQENPSQQIFVAAIDLTQPGVSVRVSRGGPDPDGLNGPWQTTLMPPTKVADREHFDIVINGDFFHHQNGKDAEGAAARTEFKASTYATVTGPAETDGTTWAVSEQARPVLTIDKAGHPSITTAKRPPKRAWETIAGSSMLVQNGKDVAPPDETSPFVKGPHPRTAVGIADHGKTLILVVADGRTKIAKGLSLKELSKIFISLGAEDALNLDGGGSSVMAIRNPSSQHMDILNHPSDGRERPVGNVLGVTLSQAAPAK